MHEAKYPVKATKTTLSIVERLNDAETAGVTELADALDLSKSVVHNHLSTLLEHDFVLKDGEQYRLSLKFLEIGGYQRHRMPLFNAAESQVDWLADQTDELANLFTDDHGTGVYLYRVKGKEGLDYDTYAGKRKYLHTTALGKAILAYKDDDEIDRIIDRHGLPAVTEASISDEAALYDELEAVRERGVAFDDEEATYGVRCVAAPIRTEDTVLGSISISAPTNRMRGDRFEQEVPDLLRRAVNVIELNIKYP